MPDDVIVAVKADIDQYEKSMDKVGEAPAAAAGKARGAFSAMNRYIEMVQRRAEILNRTKINPVARLVDRISGPVKTIENKLHSLSKTTATVVVAAKDNASKIIKKVTSTAAVIGIGATLLGGGFLVGNSLSKAMDFQAQMSSIKALTGLADAAMLDMQNLAMEMGAKTKYSALEAAKGMEELLKAGLTPAQVRAGALESALNLATAGELELAEAAEVMSTSLNAFKADGLSAAAASDILAGTANASATSVKELSYSLAQVSAVASGIGMSMRDTNVALGLFANNGLKGSDAGTSLKTMLSNLQPATKDQIELFKKLGIVTSSGANKFFTAEGKLQSLTSIAETLNNALKDMTDQMRMAYLEKMFGSDAIRAANIIFKEGPEGVKKFMEEMSKVTALQVAREKMNNAAGAVEQFKGALETLQISAMLPFLPTVKRIAEAAANLTEKVSPKITSSMESAAKKVEGFFNKLAQDEKFQHMNWGEKISYALDQIIESANNWLDGDGGKQLELVSGKVGEILSAGLEAAAPSIAKAAIIVGKAIGTAIISGFGEALQSSPIGAMILGAIPGILIGNPVVAGAGALAGLGTYAITNLGKKARESAEKTTDISFFHSPDIGISDTVVPKAMGGIISHPQLSLVGEAGPEVIIPLSSRIRGRALDLWQQTGKYLGIRQFEMGGFVGPVSAIASGAVGGGLNVNVGDIHVHLSDDKELDEDALALNIGRKIVQKIKKAIENRP
jgi:TP901 family phage tail tape measure protein